MNTIARPTPTESSHWYLRDGTPFYETPYADPKKGMRKTTLADARKVGALPSVTTILRVLDKPALTTWKIEQAVLIAMTTPRLPGEGDDAFIQRVLHDERQQEQEAEKARDLGTEIHDAIEKALNRQPVPEHLTQYVAPILVECEKFGALLATEKIVVGEGYAGKVDAVFGNGELFLVDFKTTKKVPKESWAEHKLQTSAYAKTYSHLAKPITTANIYISTTEPGQAVVCLQADWQTSFAAFESVLKVWQWMNKYQPL